MTFFRGSSESGKEGHEELAAKIGLAGKRWARDHWRKQDMAAYMCKPFSSPSLGFWLDLT
jgi:hypothetical protein